MSAAPDEREILDRERSALERWSRGDPLGYLDIDAPEVSYFDDIGASRRVDGIDALRGYLTSLRGKIPPHSYEVVEPRVQQYGDTAILTLRYEAAADDGAPLPTWKATSVYHRADGVWRIVHAHWSIAKEP